VLLPRRSHHLDVHLWRRGARATAQHSLHDAGRAGDRTDFNRTRLTAKHRPSRVFYVERGWAGLPVGVTTRSSVRANA
jgi:hypothetical protein